MITLDNVSHMPHVWNIYLHLLNKWPIHVGKSAHTALAVKACLLGGKTATLNAQ